MPVGSSQRALSVKYFTLKLNGLQQQFIILPGSVLGSDGWFLFRLSHAATVR